MSATSHQWTKRSGALLLLIAIVATLPFLNGIDGDFTFDDVFVVRDNPLVHADSPLPIFTTYHQFGMYRPITILSFFFNARFGESPFGYHVVNIALHALVSMMVFVLGRLVMGSTRIATVAALIFAVHPIHTEAVTGIVGRSEILVALSVLLTLLSLIHAERSESPNRYAWLAVSVTCFAVGLLAKEGAFAALPLVAVVHVWLFPDVRLSRRLILLAPYAVVVMAALLLRYLVLGSLTSVATTTGVDNPLAFVPTPWRVMTSIVIAWEYASQLAVPWHLSADYSFNEIRVVTSPHDPRFLAAAGLLLGGIAALLWTSRRSPEVLIAFLFLAIPLALTANLLFPIGTIKAERLLYLPSVGWCLLCAWLAAQALRYRPQLTVAVLALVVIGYAGRTWARNLDWQDNLSLFKATVETSPSSVKAHYNLGCFYQEAGRLEEAMFHFRKALAIYPRYPMAAFGIGSIYDRKGNLAGALHYYERALRNNWELPEVHRAIGTVRFGLGEVTTAESAFLTGLQYDPDDPQLLWNLSSVRYSQDEPWAAQLLREKITEEQREAIEIEPIPPNLRLLQYAMQQESR